MTQISPRIDIAFKKIFGVEENKDLLISLINSIVGQEDQISEVTLLNPYNPQSFQRDKLSILDIKAKGLDGKRFNIEIQISDEADYDKRALYYWAKLYTEQLKATESYSSLAKAIGIHILNFISIPDSLDYHNVFHITEKTKGFAYFKDLELHTIELRKFSSDHQEELATLVTRIKTSLDMWSAFLTRHDLMQPEQLPSAVDSTALKKALTVLEVMSFNEEERCSYDDHLKWLMIEASTVKKAEREAEAKGLEQGIKQGLEQGRAEGLEQGRAEGEATGIEKGIKRGKAEGVEQGIEQTAIKMLQQNLDETLIKRVTGLSKDQLLKLKNSR